jgi:hypothetical protein
VLPVAARISSKTGVAFSIERHSMSTRPPRAAKSCAATLPMPLLAPVTR